MSAPTIFLEMEGATFEDAERCREMIEIMFTHNVFSTRNGKVVLHFDSTGTLQAIDADKTLWRRDKAVLPVAKLYENVILRVK